MSCLVPGIARGTKLGLTRHSAVAWPATGIVLVGLATGYVHDVLCVADHDLDEPFQRVIDRHPVHPGALHQNVGDTQLHQLLSQLDQLMREGPKLEFELFGSAAVSDQRTNENALLVNV